MRSSTTSQEDRIDVSFNLFPRSCQLNDGLPNVCSFACAPAQQLSHASVSAALVRTRGFPERERRDPPNDQTPGCRRRSLSRPRRRCIEPSLPLDRVDSPLAWRAPQRVHTAVGKR